MQVKMSEGDDGSSVFVESYATGDGQVHVQVTKFYGDHTEDPSSTTLAFDLDVKTAHDLGLGLLVQSWEAKKADLGDVGDTFRRLGFFH